MDDDEGIHVVWPREKQKTHKTKKKANKYSSNEQLMKPT